MRFIIPLLLMFVIVTATLIASCAPAPAPLAAPTVAPNAPATVPSPSAPTSAPVSTVAAAPKITLKVEAYDDFFRPEKITITVGTQVTWVNLGERQDHTVTLDNFFDSELKTGDLFTYTFDKPGTYQYYCIPHSESPTQGMVGTITVLPK